MTSRVDLLLSAARARLHRLSPIEALHAVEAGAVVVDIRPAAQRAEHGELPGALVVERNVLEWRFDPTSEAALRIADDELHVVVHLPGGLHLEPGGRGAAGRRRPPGHGRRRRVRRVGGRRGRSPVGRPGQRLVTRIRAG